MESLKITDPQVYRLLKAEQQRQAETLMLIPSENHTSVAVRTVVGSCLQDKYCEGFPGRRYYQGQVNFDKLERLCQERAKKLFGVPYVNVQPLSGAPANSAVYFALLNPGDKMMGLRMDHGGHMTHGLAANFSGRYFQPVFYYVNKEGFIDYEAMAKLARRQRPKLIIAGITAYPRLLDFEKFARLAEEIDAWLLADVSHLAGLIAAGVYPSPVAHAHLVTTTTHKTLRGPRGAMIMVTAKGLKKDPDLPSKIERAIFPGLQGGPHENNIAGIAVALKEASRPAFKTYARQIILNAKTLAETLAKAGLRLCAGGTDTHLILLDLRPSGLSGKLAAEALEAAGMVTNYNSIPWDPAPPFFPSGLRLGTPAITSQGMKTVQMRLIGNWLAAVLQETSAVKKKLKISLAEEKQKAIREKIIRETKNLKAIKAKVKKLCRRFPIRKSY